ncbi:MAG: helicase-associated domain-containing protein [Methanomassiliicoccales archaeon]|nr:MAG: helicase-associated domain-containing protein [Methanomassiliicoccales archaeon]
MVRRNKSSKKLDGVVSTLEDKERAFLSIILMNKGRVTGPRFKRIYLEKYTLWEMQKTEKKLMDMGLLLKEEGLKSGEALEFTIPRKYISILSKSFSSKAPINPRKEQMDPISMAPCGEYSILWYLWQMDVNWDYRKLYPKQDQGVRSASKKRVEELLMMEDDGIRFIKDTLEVLSSNIHIKGEGYKKWKDVLAHPHRMAKEIFKFTFDDLREEGGLGMGEVGKDNIDFFFEELAALKIEKWYSLESFVTNAKRTLFTAGQPFRWIHFDAEGLWRIINSKLKLLGIVEIAENQDKEKFLALTKLGNYCLGGLSEKKFIKMMSLRRGKFMVHPNFEVTVVSKEINPKVLLKLAMFSEPTKLDTVSVFRITRESVKGGICLGLIADEMLSFLEENCKGTVPQNVDYSIKDWAG